MDFNDIFRSFFGSSGPRGAGHTDDEFDDADNFNTPPPFGFHDNDEQDDGMTFGGGCGFPPSGNDFFFRFEEETQDIFRHFEEMFKNFGLAEFPPSAFSRIDQGPQSRSSAIPSRHQSPRDQMLKHPDSDKLSSSVTLPKPADKDRLQEDPKGNPISESPSWFSVWNSKPKWQWIMPSLPSSTPHRVDQDLDEQFKERKLDEILAPRDPPSSQNTNPSQPPRNRSYFKSISIQTVRKSDGTVEKRRTETDGAGNVTTTVTSTNPNEPTTSPLLPSLRRPTDDDPFRFRNDETPLGQAKTNSIFEKLFGPWGRH